VQPGVKVVVIKKQDLGTQDTIPQEDLLPRDFLEANDIELVNITRIKDTFQFLVQA
jgi:hypothetical protein